MPYLKNELKAELVNDTRKALSEGTWNYLYFLAYIQEMMEKGIRYSTVHFIHKASRYPTLSEHVGTVETILINNRVPTEDREIARDEAYLEFRNRIVEPYETGARKLNGDVFQLEVLLAKLREELKEKLEATKEKK